MQSEIEKYVVVNLKEIIGHTVFELALELQIYGIYYAMQFIKSQTQNHK